jgi:hypothetical protein
MYGGPPKGARASQAWNGIGGGARVHSFGLTHPYPQCTALLAWPLDHLTCSDAA